MKFFVIKGKLFNAFKRIGKTEVLSCSLFSGMEHLNGLLHFFIFLVNINMLN